MLEEAASFILGLFFGVGVGYGISQLDKRKEKQRLEESVMEAVLSEDDKGRDPAHSHEDSRNVHDSGQKRREED